MGSDYENKHENSPKDPKSFWAEAAQAIDWDKRWEAVLDNSNPPFYPWFKGGALNTCYNALDRHIEARNGGQNALIYESPVTNTKKYLLSRDYAI